MNLIIVESPTKAKTISRFLGSGFLVRSSFGHVRDLPKSKLGVDVADNFKPKYVIPTKAKKVISELKDALAESDEVIMATDEDREGEAIAWHLAQALGENEKSVKRIVFHEITKSAIENSLKHPRVIDMNLVDAQQARRILDRLVGYELSPFLWRKIRYGLSAGRVQSVALRLVVERERDIQGFVKEEYWTVEADLAPGEAEKKSFRARLIKIGEKALEKLDIKNESEAKKIFESLNSAQYKVKAINKKEVKRHPAPPFTTSTLQQEASRKLGFSAKQTMTLAQRLYETGYITYMRTDSVSLAQTALDQAREVIIEHFGREYSLEQPRFYATKSKGAQEAHEAIRPTELAKRPELLSKELDRGQARLYDLIWKRTIATQMQEAIFDQTQVDIVTSNIKGQSIDGFTFRANGQVIKFDGFIRAYTEGRDDDGEEEVEGQLPDLSVDEILNLIKLHQLQHFTEPPPRYSDATLVKALEAHGIGRPSTYAPTLATIQDRGYVERIEKKYQPTEIGFLVNDMLVENFPEIVDINFTSHIEEQLDDIAEGKIKWVPVIEEFYAPFKKHLTEKEVSVEKLIETSTTPCPHCGKMMIIKFGRMGKFLACPDPESKITLPLPEEAAQIKALQEKTAGEMCPLCGKPMEVKRGRFGYFLGCTDYPKCKGIMKILNKTGFKCPNCRAQRGSENVYPESVERAEGLISGGGLIGDIVEKKSRGRGKIFYACSRWPDCTFIMNKKPENETELNEALKYWQENPPKTRKPYLKK